MNVSVPHLKLRHQGNRGFLSSHHLDTRPAHHELVTLSRFDRIPEQFLQELNRSVRVLQPLLAARQSMGISTAISETGPKRVGREASGKGLKMIFAGCSPHLRWRASESRLVLGVLDTMDVYAFHRSGFWPAAGFCLVLIESWCD